MWFHRHKFKCIFKRQGQHTSFNIYQDSRDHDVIYYVDECKCGEKIGYCVDAYNKKTFLNPDIIFSKIGKIDIWEKFQAEQKLEWLENLKETKKEN